MEKMSGKSESSTIIPKEIVLEILKELPVKTLLRFRAVSKLWRSIIDDPIFINSHLTRSYTRTGGIRILCQYIEFSILKIYSTDPQGGSPVPFPAFPVGIQLGYRGRSDDLDIDYYTFLRLQSVNGLVCRKNCIWNPSTRESFDLPPISIDANGETRCSGFKSYLLGFDSVTKQYKVVNLCENSFEFRILTLGRDLYWRNLDSIPENLCFTADHGVYCVEDVIFCLGFVGGTEVIVAFEVGPEKFKVIPLPIGEHASFLARNIIQVRGCLGFINVEYARAGVDVDPLMNVKVVECLDYVEARDVDSDDGNDYVVTGLYYSYGDGYYDDDDDDDDNVEWVMVMNIWILEDYHKQQWKKEKMLTFPSSRKYKYNVRTGVYTTLMGSIDTNEILLRSEGKNQHGDYIWICSYYDLERKSLRMVPKLTEFAKDEHQKNYGKDLQFIGFTKHVECLFRLKVTQLD
ncbi:hypothetical protein LguiA_029064 [Lonicera macranthoides]